MFLTKIDMSGKAPAAHANSNSFHRSTSFSERNYREVLTRSNGIACRLCTASEMWIRDL